MNLKEQLEKMRDELMRENTNVTSTHSYDEGYNTLLPIVLKMAEALEKANQDLEFFHHANKRYLEAGQPKQHVEKVGTPIRSASKVVTEALAELQAFARGGK